MDKKALWHIFEQTGKVSDYLNYVSAETDEPVGEERRETQLRGVCDMADQNG